MLLAAMSNPAENVIRKSGGAQVVADWCEVDVSNVHRWTYPKDRGGSEGLIPARHQQIILERARKAGVDVQPSDFFYSAALGEDTDEGGPRQPEPSPQAFKEAS